MNETKPQIADDPAFSPSRRLSIAELSGHILRGLREQVKTMLSHDALCDGSKCHRTSGQFQSENRAQRRPRLIATSANKEEIALR
jgi:hypothetical protein